jgi:hypothetical protein
VDNPGGVLIYRSENFFKKNDLEIYGSVLRKLFFEARGRQYLFLPKFGKSGSVEFFNIVIHEFADFIRKYPHSKLRLALVIYEDALIQEMAQRAEFIRQEKFRVDNEIDRFKDQESLLSNDLATIGSRMTWNQGNLLHVFHTLRFSDEYKDISAIFVPIFGNLAETFQQFISSRASNIEPVNKTDIAALIAGNYSPNSERLAGDPEAPSLLSSFAKFLSPYNTVSEWPNIGVSETGITIFDYFRKVKPQFLPILNNFNHSQSYASIPFHSLQEVFKAFDFRMNFNRLSTTAYIIIYSQKLSTLGKKYRAVYNMVRPAESELRVPEFLRVSFADSLSGKIMINPAVTPDGLNYEKDIIAQWAEMTHRDPYSSEYLIPDMLVENTRLKNAILAVHNGSVVQGNQIVLENITSELIDRILEIVNARETGAKDYNAQLFLKAMIPYLEKQKQNEISLPLIIQRIKNLEEIKLIDHSNEELILSRDAYNSL